MWTATSMILDVLQSISVNFIGLAIWLDAVKVNSLCIVWAKINLDQYLSKMNTG